MMEEKDKEAPEKQTASHMHQFKKYLASKTAGSKQGRKVIGRFLGDEGNSIISALKKASAIDVGVDQAKEKKASLLKIALKVRLLFGENVLTPKDTMHAVDPLNSVCRQVIHYLEMERPPNTRINVKPLVSNFARMKSIIIDLLDPHLTKKNVDLTCSLCDYFGGERFLDKLVNDDNMEDYRHMILTNLRALLLPLQLEFDLKTTEDPKEEPCAVRGCPHFAVMPQGDFRGSKYCARHHMKEYEQILTHPSFKLYTKDLKALAHFSDFLGQEHTEGREHFNFYWAALQYSVLGTNLRKSRGQMIFRKYINTDSPAKLNIPPEIIKSTEEGLSTCSRKLFDPAADIVCAYLEKVFSEKFLKSAQYKKCLASMQLPASVLAQVEAEDKGLAPPTGSPTKGAEQKSAGSSPQKSAVSPQKAAASPPKSAAPPSKPSPACKPVSPNKPVSPAKL